MFTDVCNPTKYRTSCVSSSPRASNQITQAGAPTAHNHKLRYRCATLDARRARANSDPRRRPRSSHVRGPNSNVQTAEATTRWHLPTPPAPIAIAMSASTPHHTMRTHPHPDIQGPHRTEQNRTEHRNTRTQTRTDQRRPTKIAVPMRLLPGRRATRPCSVLSRPQRTGCPLH